MWAQHNAKRRIPLHWNWTAALDLISTQGFQTDRTLEPFSVPDCTALTNLYYFEPLGPRLFSTGPLEPFSVQVPDWPAPHFPISVIFSLGRATFYFSARPQIRLKVVPVKSCLWFSFNPKGTGTCTLFGLQCIVYQCATLIVLNHPVVLIILDKYTPRLKDHTLDSTESEFGKSLDLSFHLCKNWHFATLTLISF